MIDHCNKTEVDIEYGKAKVLKKGTKGTVVAFADALDVTISACTNLDVTLLYYTTAAPFDLQTLMNNIENNRIYDRYNANSFKGWNCCRRSWGT